MNRRLLAVVVLLAAALLLPGLSATKSGIISLETVDSTSGSTTKASAGTTTYEVDYVLRLDQSATVFLATRVDPAGQDAVRDHNATWRVDGTLRGTTTRTTVSSSFVLSAGDHTVRVTWGLGQTMSLGAYDLTARVARDTSGTPGGGGVTADVGTAVFTLTLQAPSSGGSGGGTTPPPSSSSSSSSSSTGVPPPSESSSSSSSSPSTPPAPPASPPAPPATPPPDVRERAPPELLQALEQVAGEVVPGSFILVRDPETRQVTAVEGLDEQFITLRIAPDQGIVFLQTRSTSTPVLLLVGTNEAVPVARPAATLLADEVQTKGTLTVRVDQKEGWIEVAIEHTCSDDRPVVGAEAQDDAGTREIPPSLVWCEGGMVRLLDDPTTSYTFRFADSQLPTEAAPEEDALPWNVVGFLAAAVLATFTLVVLLRRRA